jgi:Holliday junction resolvasome RuvABC endonuclease subunit
VLCVGVDVSTKALAVGGIRADRSITVSRLELDPKARGARRLVGARSTAYGVLSAFAADVAVIAVEVPIVGGRANNKELLAVAYVVVEAAQAACPGAIVMDVPLSTWRKDVLGRGNADKHDALWHVEKFGDMGDDHDIAEALCVAEYAWQRWDAATREQAA